MKNKQVFVIIILALLFLKSYSQTQSQPQWNWAQGALGGSNYFDGSYGVAVASDASGAMSLQTIPINREHALQTRASKGSYGCRFFIRCFRRYVVTNDPDKSGAHVANARQQGKSHP